MVTDGFIHQIMIKNNRPINRPLLIGKNKKFISKFKDELGGKIMIECT